MHAPIRFQPIFFPRVWGGRALERFPGKDLPAGQNIGESWELVDRPEAQSVVRAGAWRGRSLHDLWVNERASIFGWHVPGTPRFPLLLKLLDCRETLSLQVHPPPDVAAALGGEPKTEAWYIISTTDGAEIFVGTKKGITRDEFAKAIAAGTAAECVEKLSTVAGQFFLLPSGQVHAIGGGNLIFEAQQNSDTTYRVFDWNRTEENGKARALHTDAALRSIDFSLETVAADNGPVAAQNHFLMEKLVRDGEFAPPGRFAIGFVARGAVACAGETFATGELFLLPADANDRRVELHEADLLRVTIPPGSKANSAR